MLVLMQSHLMLALIASTYVLEADTSLLTNLRHLRSDVLSSNNSVSLGRSQHTSKHADGGRFSDWRQKALDNDNVYFNHNKACISLHKTLTLHRCVLSIA
jgi:hypothetical protein